MNLDPGPLSQGSSELDDSEIKRREEEKRRLAQPPLTWEQIAEMLTWAESHLPPEQRRNRPRVHPSNPVS